MKEENRIRTIQGRIMPFLEDNIDTDQIAPTQEALYITNWKEAGDVFCIKARQDPNHVLNHPLYQGARILLTGRNFGCGSSREHATQGTKARYDAVLAVSFAPIYSDNAFAIGLPVFQMRDLYVQELSELVQKNPAIRVTINIENRIISYDSYAFPLEIDEAKREGFLKGTWDEREKLVSNLHKTRQVISQLPYTQFNTYR